jgi:uncharacterized protein
VIGWRSKRMRLAISLCAALAGLQVAAWAADFKPPTAKADVQQPTDRPSADVVRAVEEQLSRMTQPAYKPLPELKGVVSWKTLGQVSVVRQKDRLAPEFSKEITLLDKQQVRLQGFLMPLEVGEKQKRFLLTATPSTCSFCLPGGPEQLVEVQAKNPVRHSLEPVVVSGRFVVLRDDPNGLYYRMTDAVALER